MVQLPVLGLQLEVMQPLLVPESGLQLVTGQSYWYSGGKEEKLKMKRGSTAASSLCFWDIMLETTQKCSFKLSSNL